MNKVTKLVEHHPQLHSKLEAAIRKEDNEEPCAIYKVSNDELKYIFGYVGEKQYGFVACVLDRFHQVSLESFGNETLTSIESAAVSVSRGAQLCSTMPRYGKAEW